MEPSTIRQILLMPGFVRIVMFLEKMGRNVGRVIVLIFVGNISLVSEGGVKQLDHLKNNLLFTTVTDKLKDTTS